jgi:sugar phosphate isomerase/epimerase
MFINLSPSAIGIHVDFVETVNLAQRHGWQGCDLPVGEAIDITAAHSFDVVVARFTQASIQPGGWALPLNWREPYDQAALATLGRQAALAAQLGCTRAYTWLMPASDDRAFHENFAYHVAQLRPVAQVLAEHGCRLGLEFIGPRTMRAHRRYGFIYSPDAMLCLAAALGPNVGLLLDCWHWYTALGTLADIRSLRADDIVYVHVNDAPAGIPIEEQVDQVRQLPGATGVIDIAGFLQVLREIGYDGPVTPEPFDQQLATLPADKACYVTREHMHHIWNQAGLE